MKRAVKTKQELLVEVEELRQRLEEAEETLRAIRSGEVDGLVVLTSEGEQVFTLAGADYPYRVLIEQMNEGAFTMASDGTILYCNSRFAEMIKKPLEKVINSSFFQLIEPENRELIDAMIRGEGGEKARSEINLRAGSRSTVPVYFSVNFMETGDTRTICAVVSDLTEQKRNEEILKAAKLANSILDQSTEAIFICDENGRIIQTSQEAHRYFSAKMLRQPFDSVCRLSVASPSSSRSRRFSISSVLSGKIIRSQEVTQRRDNTKESHFLLSARPLIDDQKRILGCVVSLTDITERKQAEQQRERLRVEAENEKRRLQAVMEALPVGVAITDAKGGNILSNNAFEQVWGGPRPVAASVTDYALYKAWWSETGKPVAPEEWASAQAVEKGETVVGQLLEIQRFDGSRASVINSGAPIFDSDGKIAGCAVAIQDITELRRAEQALRESEERLRRMIETSPVAIGFGDSTGKIFDANESFYRLTGYTREEIQVSQLGWDRLTAPEYAELDRQIMATLAATGSAGPYEKEYIRKDGSRVPMLLSVSKFPERDEHIAFILDITERKQMEEALQESEGRYRALIELAPDAIVVHRDNRFLYANSAAIQLYGATTFEQLAAYSISDLLHPNEREPVADRSQMVMRGEKTPVRETRLLRLDGKEVPVEATAAPIMYQGSKAVQAIIRDITQRKKAEEALEAAREEVLNEKNRLEAVMEALPVGVVITDSKGGIIRFNQAYDAVWSKPRPTALSIDDYAPYRAWWSETGVPVVPEEWASAQAVEKGKPVVGQLLEIQRFDGSRASIINSGAPIFDADGKISGCAVAIQDITDLRKAEEALRKNKERFELLSETANKLLATDTPQQIVNELCQKVMTHLDCDVFINYLADEERQRLHLNAYTGIPEETANEIEWLDYGVAVCGCAARDVCRIVAEDIPNTPDPRTELVKSFGIKVYACHPLLSTGRVIGTLSFGTRTRTTFAEEELSLMKTVADQVAISMERIQLIDALKRSRSELEIRVDERTAELAKQSKILEGFFTSTITPLVFLDRDFNFIRVNEAYAKACQRKISEFPGHNHFEFYPHEENEAIFKKVVETKTPYQAFARPFSFPGHPEWGITYWDWNLTPLLDEKGEVEFLVFSLEDVTERKQAEEAVNAERQRFNDVLEILPAYVALLTPDYHIPFANRIFRERFGESDGRRCFEFLFGRTEPCEICETYTVLKTNAPHHWEWTGPDGRIYDVFDFPFTDTDGSPLILEMGMDITERKRAEENLRQMQKMEALGTLAGGIAHDFNNILMPITINTEMALLDTPEGSPVYRYLHPVLDAAKRGKDLVTQIISFSRQKELERHPIKISPVIKEAIRFLRSSLPKNIEFHESIETEADTIQADPTQIHQILMNLANNAAYAMREKGGIIGIRLTRIDVDSEMAAKYSTLKEGPHLRLTVNDTGCGMSKEVIDNIFNPFFTTKKPGEGIGMGLAVVHSIVKNHGGAISVYSEIEKGTTFHIFFPIVQDELGPGPISQTSIPTGGENILLVDDEEVQLKSVRQMLERFGYNVVAKRDSGEALNSFQEKPEAFDLVITDQTMPKMTGERLAESILRIRPNIPIILCTGFSEVVDADKARAMGIREFVMKPFTLKEMAETIRKALKK